MNAFPAVANAEEKQIAWRHLRPRNRAGWMFTAIVSICTGAAIWLSLQGRLALWASGQALFAVAFVMWFVILHEAGHRTLFRSRVLNVLVGHLAGFFALIPYGSWQRIHARHHRWTGWQDMDASTASLVPRTLAWPERWAVNAAWFTGFPVPEVPPLPASWLFPPKVNGPRSQSKPRPLRLFSSP